MEEQGDILINGKPYRTVPGTRRKQDLVDFSPRSSTPGGSIIQSELGLYQPLLQTSWQHGFGFPWYEDALGYMRTQGNVDTRHDGIAMLFTAAVASETNANNKEGGVVWDGAWWMWGAAGLRRYASATWTSVYSAAAVNFVLALGDYLFFCPDGGRIQRIPKSSTTPENAGIDANAVDFSYLVVHNGFVYASVDGTNRVHYGSANDLSDLHGDVAGDTNEIYIGAAGGPEVLSAIVFSGRLFWEREDGIWELGEDRIARPVLSYAGERSSANFRSVAVHNGFLIYAVRDALFAWNGARQTNITPPYLTDTFPYLTYGRFDNFVVVGDYLYMTARTNESTYTESLLCYDGVGWFKLLDFITDGDGSVTGMGFDPGNNYLWAHVAKAATHSTQYIPFQSLSDFPYAAFPTTGTHRLVSSRLDMGFRRVTKSTPSLLVGASNLDGGTYLNVYYSLDGAAFVLWDSVNENGVTELLLPGALNTVEYNYIVIAVDLITDDAAQSPILEDITLRFLMRPDVSYGYSYDIVMATGIEYNGVEDDRTAAQMEADLETARASKKPIKFTDHVGRKHLGYISALTIRDIDEHLVTYDNLRNVEQIARVNLVTVAEEDDGS